MQVGGRLPLGHPRAQGLWRAFVQACGLLKGACRRPVCVWRPVGPCTGGRAGERRRRSRAGKADGANSAPVSLGDGSRAAQRAFYNTHTRCTLARGASERSEPSGADVEREQGRVASSHRNSLYRALGGLGTERSTATAMPSLLETVQALEQSLLARFAAASSPLSSSSSSSTALPALPLHPLHAAVAQNGDPNASVAALRAQVQATLQTLRSGLAEFPLAAMDDPVDETANATSSAPNADVQQRRLARDRYLVQLRDAAHSEAAILRLTSSTASNGPARKPRRRVEGAAVAQDDRWPVRTPGNGGAGGAGAAPTSTLQLLEEVAAELGLVTFRDDDAGAGGGPASAIDTTMSAGPSAPVTLSLGGKVMVIDFSVLPASDGSSGRVEHVKVAYVAAGQDRQAHSFASKLEALFRYSSTRAEGEVEAARQTAAEKEQVTWKGVRRVLAQLKQLDEATEKSGRDAFQELDQLGQGLAEQVVTCVASRAPVSPSYEAYVPPPPTVPASDLPHLVS